MAPIDAIKLPFLGITGTEQIGGQRKTAPVTHTGYVEPVEYSGQNPFAGNLTGVNTNIGIGDYQDAQYQAGRKLGGRTLAFA